MTRIAALVTALLFAAPPTPKPAPPLGTLPSIPRVRIDVAAADHAVVTEDVDLPRGDWHGGPLTFYVAFGSPGAPQAFDARLLTVPDGALEPAENDPGEKMVTERAPRRPDGVHALLGPDEMAGVVVHVPEAAYKHALEPGGMAVLRFRTLLRLPAVVPHGPRDLLVRLGQAKTTPLTLGFVQVGSLEGGPSVNRAEAHLCGEDADPWPLAVATPSKPLPPAPQALAGSQTPVAPVLAVRHAKDDLCVRFWLND